MYGYLPWHSHVLPATKVIKIMCVNQLYQQGQIARPHLRPSCTSPECWTPKHPHPKSSHPIVDTDFGKSVCVCVFSSHPFWTSSSLDVPAGVTQEEGHTGFLIHLPSAVRALIFVARRIQPFLSLVDREVEFCVLTIESFSTRWAFLFWFLVLSEKNPVCRDRTHVPTCQKVTRCQPSYRGRPAYSSKSGIQESIHMTCIGNRTDPFLPLTQNTQVFTPVKHNTW